MIILTREDNSKTQPAHDNPALPSDAITLVLVRAFERVALNPDAPAADRRQAARHLERLRSRNSNTLQAVHGVPLSEIIAMVEVVNERLTLLSSIPWPEHGRLLDLVGDIQASLDLMEPEGGQQ